MKKLLAPALSIASLVFPIAAFAQEDPDTSLSLCPPGDNQFSVLCVAPDGIGGIVGTVITFIFILAIIVALIFLIYGGLKWIVSGGDKGKVEEARNTIIAAIIGLVVVFLSYLILNFVLNLFGLSLTELRLPQLPGA